MEEQLLRDVKLNISCLLTSSKDPLSVRQLIKDFEMSEGRPIPYRKLGFSSVIELLKSLTDIVSLPENANLNSILSLIACDKSNHLRILVNKQKSQKKKRPSDKNNNFSHNNKSSSATGISQKKMSHNYQTNGNNYFCRNGTSSNNQVQNKVYCTGHVTKELKEYLEKTVDDNKYLTVNQLMESVKKHQDFPLLKAKTMNDVIHLVSSFLEIKGSYVVLKNPVKNENQHVPHSNGHNKDELNILSSNSKSLTNSLSDCRSILADIDINGVTDLLSKLTTYSSEEDMNSMVLTTQSVKIPTNHYQMVNDDSFNDLKTSFCHSSPKENKYNITDTKNGKLSMYKNHQIPKEVLLNITRIFDVYNEGLNVDNFELLYNILFDTSFDSTTYGFETIIQLFKMLPQIIEIKSNVLYKKSEVEFNECISLKHHNNHNAIAKEENINRIQSEIKMADISLHVEQKLFSSNQDSSKTKMVLADIYNPSLFYVHIYADGIKLTDLLDQMKHFYNEDNINFVVKPDHIFPGLTYASSYTSFSNEKQWLRVKVLGEVDSDLVKVIHVDYGTVDLIPKTELKFLTKKFSSLPCQAICCCLTSFNELGSIEPEVTHNFLELINKEPFLVQVDSNFTFDSFCDRYQILHVTLFQQINGSEVYININNKLSRVLKE